MTARVVREPTMMTCAVCGYARTYQTAGLASAHFPKHSCEKQREQDARAVRMSEAGAREGERRDCHCPRAQHVHGTRTAYVVDRCRCRPCMDASTRAQRERAKLTAYGRYNSGRVDAEPVREHIRRLITDGVSLKRLAMLTGLSLSTVSATLYGRPERGHDPYPRTSKKTAELILAVKPSLDTMAAGRVIDSTGTLRRLQALVTIGWSISRLGERLGVSPTNMVAAMKRPMITAGRARAVVALYEELWDKPQHGTDQHSRISANRARRYAAERGWVPPMAWDDDTIDNPSTVPDRGEPVQSTIEARIEDAEHMINTGAPFGEAAQRIGLTEKTLETYLYRAGRPDLITAREQRDYRKAS